MGPPSITANLPLIKTTTVHIKRANSTKLLGIHLDSNFSWQPHIEAILANATQRLYFLKQLTRAGVPYSKLLHFYLTVIRPVLEYASPVCMAPFDYKEAVRPNRSHSDESYPHHLPLCTRYAVYKCIFLADLSDLLTMCCQSQTAVRRDQLARKLFKSTMQSTSSLHK